MNVWFTSDHHFGHRNIIRFCNRPFGNVAEMDEALIDAWNSVVGDDDEVWHLGDFAYRCGPRRMADIFSRLRGRRVHLVRGNHDGRQTIGLPWASIQDRAEFNLDTTFVVLSHYALRVWNRCHHGAWSLYGHSHGTLPPEGRSGDVGVDCWDYRPISLEQLVEARRRQVPEL